jgi:hypothetical protein
MVCATVTLAVDFDWVSMSLTPDVPVEIKLHRPRRQQD